MTAAEFLAWTRDHATRDHATRGNAADEAAVAFAEGHFAPVASDDQADDEARAGAPFGVPDCGTMCGEWQCTRKPGHSGHHVAATSRKICHRWPR